MPHYAAGSHHKFFFLHSASHAEEIAKTAAALNLSAIAVTDRNTLAGIVRAHRAAKEAGIKLVVGARLDLQDAPSLLSFPTDRDAYARLSQLITLGRRRASKGECEIYLEDVFAHSAGQLSSPCRPTLPAKITRHICTAYGKCLVAISGLPHAADIAATMPPGYGSWLSYR